MYLSDTDPVICRCGHEVTPLGDALCRACLQAERADAARETAAEIAALVEAERANWERVATWNPPGPTLRERALAKMEVCASLYAAIAANEREGTKLPIDLGIISGSNLNELLRGRERQTAAEIADWLAAFADEFGTGEDRAMLLGVVDDIRERWKVVK